MIRELPALPSCDAGWSADGKVAMTSNGQSRSTLWNAETWQPIATFEGADGGDTTTFALSPDGAFAIINRDQSLSIVSTHDGTRLARLQIPGGPGNTIGIRFLPDGRRFGILWLNGRIDIIDLPALRDRLKPLGLDW